MVAIDIGGSHITSIDVTDVLTGKVNGEIKNSHIQIRNKNNVEILDYWAENINSIIKSIKEYDGKMAIAIPGPFDYQNGIVQSHPNGKFVALEGVNLRREFKNRISACDHIFFENDATCFGIGEFYYGQKFKAGRIVAVTLGTGVGSAFIDNGTVIKTSSSVPTGGEVYKLPFKNLTADDCFSTRWFVNECHKNELLVSGVRELISYGNGELLNKIFEEFANNFCAFFIPIVKDFKADSIVIGGNISKAWRYFGPKITEVFKKLKVDVIKSESGEKITCLGAARSMHNYLNS